VGLCERIGQERERAQREMLFWRERPVSTRRIRERERDLYLSISEYLWELPSSVFFNLKLACDVYLSTSAAARVFKEERERPRARDTYNIKHVCLCHRRVFVGRVVVVVVVVVENKNEIFRRQKIQNHRRSTSVGVTHRGPRGWICGDHRGRRRRRDWCRWCRVGAHGSVEETSGDDGNDRR